jgi:hypothetical protein
VARKKSPSVRVKVHTPLARRLREIREEIFGEHGGPELARRLGLPARSWYNYETGVTVPAEVLLGFIEQTGASPRFLSTGEGPRYLRSSAEQLIAELSPVELIRRGLERLERSAADGPLGLPGDLSADYVAVRVYPLERIGDGELDSSAGEGEILGLRHWIANPAQTFAVRVDDDAMHPILPAGSIVAIDRSLTDPIAVQGRIVAACPAGTPMIRWLEVSGRHIILRPNRAGGEHPIIPLEIDRARPSPILGAVVCSWSRFGDA